MMLKIDEWDQLDSGPLYEQAIAATFKPRGALMPCPFCGGKAKRKCGKYNLLGAYGTQNEDREWFGVYCSECGVAQPKKKYNTRELSNEAWNNRAFHIGVDLAQREVASCEGL